MGTGYNQNGEPCGHCTGPNRTRERHNCNCTGAPPRTYRSDHLVRNPEADVPIRRDGDLMDRMFEAGERFRLDPSRWARAATITTAASAAAAHGMFDRIDITHPAGFLFTTGVATGGTWLARRWQQGRVDKQNRELVREHIDVGTTKLNVHGQQVRGSEVDNWAVMGQEPLTFGYAGRTGEGTFGNSAMSLNYLCKQREDGRWDWEGEISTHNGEVRSHSGIADTPQRGRDELSHIEHQRHQNEKALERLRSEASPYGIDAEKVPEGVDEKEWLEEQIADAREKDRDERLARATMNSDGSMNRNPEDRRFISSGNMSDDVRRWGLER